MLGSSGVGKSTLAKTMGAHKLSTAAIRAGDDKGRHTTTFRSMHQIRFGGWLIDNPGMREFQLPQCEQGLEDVFEDVLQFAEHCRFRDCGHQGDAGCAVAAAVSNGDLDSRRLTSYLKLQSEQARNAESLAERREKDRQRGRFYKSVLTEKNRRRGQP
jgi:ribosome biogenesis GTPase